MRIAKLNLKEMAFSNNIPLENNFSFSLILISSSAKPPKFFDELY